MKKNNTINKNIVVNNNILQLSNTVIRRITFIFLLMFTFGISSKIQAQVITQPVTDLSSNIKKYIYTYKLSNSEKKDIRYITVKSSNGDIKSCFDACDVCYAANKGYSQIGNELKCNNCGNRFKIDELGTQGKGGCWPGHLPHTDDPQNVIFNISDLTDGAYLFPVEIISDVDEFANNDKSSLNIFIKNERLTVKLPNSESRNLKVFSLDGRIVKDLSSSSNELSIYIGDLSSGIYIVLTEINGIPVSKSFYFSK